VEANAPFLLVEQDPQRKRETSRGKGTIWPRERGATVAVPRGIIHDWVGAVFVPHATLKDVFSVTMHYERVADRYGPTIVHGRLLAHLLDGDGDVSSIRYVRHVMFVTATLDVDFDNRYVQLSPLRWYSVSRSVQMREKDGGVYMEQESVALSRPIPLSLHWLF